MGSVSVRKLQLAPCHGERSPNDPRSESARASPGSPTSPVLALLGWESNHPEKVSLAIPRPGVLPRQRHLHNSLQRKKCMEENSLKPHGKGQIVGMLRLCARPASGTRAP